MPIAREQFVRTLVDTGLLTAEQLAEVDGALSQSGAAPDSTRLAEELVRRGLLTKFQSANVLDGRAQNLALGNYVVLDRLGAGGMGQVYRARHARMKRLVAIKVLPRKAVASPDALARFMREVQAAAMLVHPNIATAFDAQEAGGMHFLVMELVDGPNLSALVKREGKLPVDRAVNYILQAARGLEHAHAKGIVHRDIKPGNMMVDGTDTLKILDMGLARFAGADSTSETPKTAEHDGLTQSGSILGTVDYMAPEQAVDTREADNRADIYSLGCTLHFLLTGNPPYAGESVVGRIMAHRDQPIPNLRAARPDVSDAVQRAFERMMAKQPDDRYASMTELIADLERAQSTPHVASALPPQAMPAASPSSAAPPSGKFKQAQSLPAKSAATKKPVWQSVPVLAGGGVAVLLFIVVVALALKSSPKPVDEVANVASQSPEPPAASSSPSSATTATKPVSASPQSASTPTSVFSPPANPPAQPTTPNAPPKIGSPNTMPSVSAPPTTSPAVSVPKPAASDPDRRAAEWIIQSGGEVVVKTASGPPGPPVKTVAALPAAPFKVWAVIFNMPVNSFDEAGLLNLVGCQEIKSLRLPTQPISEVGFAHIAKLKSLYSIDAHHTPVEGAALIRCAKSLPNLQNLDLGCVQFADSDLNELRGLPPLLSISLALTPVKSDVIQILQTCPKLSRLTLKLTDFSDADVPALAQIKNLRAMDLSGTDVSEAGAAELKRLRPECVLTMGANGFNRLTDHPSRSELRAYELVVTNGGRAQVRRTNGNVEFYAFPQFTSVRTIEFNLIGIDLSNCQSLNNDGLRFFTGLKHLKSLTLTGTNISSAALSDLAATLPADCIITASVPFERKASPVTVAAATRSSASSPSSHATPATAQPSKAPAPSEPAPDPRSPIPDDKDVTAALATIKKRFAADYSLATSTEGKNSLFNTLLGAAPEDMANPAEAYALSLEARHQAIELGDTKLLADAVNRLAAAYQVNTLENLADGWLEMAKQKTRSPEGCRALANGALDQMDGAVSVAEFGAAEKFSEVAVTAGRRANDNALVRLIVERGKQLTAQRKEWDAVSAARKTLVQKPDDAAAALVVGRFECFALNDWQAGLPRLAASSDPALADLAQTTLAAGDDPAALAAAGDSWWDAAQKAKGDDRFAMLAAAAEQYGRAKEKLTGLVKLKIEQRIAQIEKDAPPPRVVPRPKSRENLVAAGGAIASEGWKVLFDGKSTDGWVWRDNLPYTAPLEEGALVMGTRRNNALVYNRELGDFKLTLELRADPTRPLGGGINLRCRSLADTGSGLEVELKGRGTTSASTGALYPINSPTADRMLPPGEWNAFEITCQGPEIKVAINGEVVNQVNLDEWTTPGVRPDGTRYGGWRANMALKDMQRRGFISIQDEGQPYWVRNIRLQELSADGRN